MGEPPKLPLYTTKAHVFQIDPATKKSWLAKSKEAVNISFYFDTIKSSFKILSIDSGKAILNCTITHGMVFTRTSQKFGQWADAKAGTVYGLGFPNEVELTKFLEKFNEVKSTIGSGASPEGTLTKHSTVQIVTPPLTLRGEQQANGYYAGGSSGPGSIKSISSASTGSVEDGSTQSPGSHRSSSSSSESQLKYENDRLKKALAQSSANSKKWESEFQTLKNNNARLTAALQESAVNVEKWKEQLNNYKEENTRLRKKQTSSTGSVGSTSSNTDPMEQRLHETEIKLKRKEEEINRLSQHSGDELRILRDKNTELVRRIQMLESERKHTEKAKNANENIKWTQANDVRHEMEVKIKELSSLQHKMNSLFKNS